MSNEYILFLHCLLVSLCCLGGIILGRCALFTLICLLPLMANLLVTKQITIFGLQATATDAYIIGSTLALNLLQERWGIDITKQALRMSFFCLLFYVLFTTIHVAYIPSGFDMMHIHYQMILGYMPRIAVASVCAYAFSQVFDTWLYRFLRLRNHMPAVLASTMSISTSQLIDTVIFTFLGLSGIMTTLVHIIFVSYVIKLISIILIIPLTKVLCWVADRIGPWCTHTI